MSVPIFDGDYNINKISSNDADNNNKNDINNNNNAKNRFHPEKKVSAFSA